jgi:hypothetical protein
VDDQSIKKRKTHNVIETRCGCEAHIYVKPSSDKKYQIASMVEYHNHGLVSPNKRHLLRSRHHVNARAKSTLFNCHKARIGTSPAYGLLHVSEGGFQNVGCTLRGLKNYYHDLRSRMKDVDAQMFVAQIERKKEVNCTFFMTLRWMHKEGLCVCFGQMQRAEKIRSILVTWYLSIGHIPPINIT